MEEKILQKLDSMQNSIQTQMNGMQNQIDGMQTQINNMQTQMNKRFEEIDQDITEIRQQQFVFEETYGKKIDAIFDCVTMQMQRSQKHSEEMQELLRRMDSNEITMLNYDRRITNLELKR